MTFTKPLKLISSISSLLLIVSLSATANHNPIRIVNRTIQIPLDTPSVTVSQNSTYFMPGQDIEITVQACNKERISSVSIGGSRIALMENGMARRRQPSGSVGMHSINVDITFLDSDGKSHVKIIPVEYEVGQACAIVDEGNLNLLYIGVDNPLYISASGGGDATINTTIRGTGSTITRSGPGLYQARVSTVSEECIVSVFVDGRMAGAKIFRAIHLPVPAASVGKFISGNRLSANEFANQAGLKVVLDDFPFPVNHKVTGYTIKILTGPSTAKSYTSSGASFPPDFKKEVSQLKPGAVIVIDDIDVEEQATRKIKLPALVYFID